MRRRYLRNRLMVLMLLLVVVTMIFVGITLFSTIVSNYNNAFYADMQQLREKVDFFEIKEIDGLIDYINTQEVVNPLMTDRNYFLLRGDTVIYGNAGGGIIERTDNLQQVLAGGEQRNSNLFEPVLDYAWRYSKTITIYIVDHRTEMIASIHSYIMIFLQTLAIGMALAVALSFFFARGFLVPIQKLTQSARRMQQGEFEMIPNNGRDEVGILTNVFNEMGKRITRNLEMLKELLRNIPKPVFAVDSEGAAFYSNQAFEAIFEGEEQIEQLFLPRKETKSMMLWKGRYYSVYRNPFLLEDGTEGTLFLLDDITEAELLEQERKQFVADVSHELKTPLTVIKSYSETLLEQQPDAQTTNRFLQVINRSSDQMNAMVNQLLSLLRTEAAKEQVKEPVDLVVAVQEVLEAMALEFQKKNLSVSVEAPAERVLLCDGEQLRRVMINLLSNSVKYSNAGGAVSVAIREAEGGVLFAVEDRGIGIEKKHLPHLFEKFYRVDKARSRETGGTGLGLSIVQEIVSAMGGRVEVQSTFGEGSTFTCFFPD